VTSLWLIVGPLAMSGAAQESRETIVTAEQHEKAAQARPYTPSRHRAATR
jgi:hypothetical protein